MRGSDVTRLFSSWSIPLLIALAGCPPQEEPVHVGKVEAKAPPESPRDRASPPAPREPAPPLPSPPGTDGEGGPSGESVPVDTAAPEKTDTIAVTPTPRPVPHEEPKRPAKPEPMPASAGAAVDGKALFASKCKTCHGADGKADTKMGEKHDIPDMTQPDWDRKWPAAKIVEMVRDGKSGTKMRAFRDKLDPAQIEAVAAYTRSL